MDERKAAREERKAAREAEERKAERAARREQEKARAQLKHAKLAYEMNNVETRARVDPESDGGEAGPILRVNGVNRGEENLATSDQTFRGYHVARLT